MSRISLAILFFLCFVSYSFAARPLSTDDAATVEEGHFEIEYGIEYVNQLDKEINLSLVAKRGFCKNLDLGIEVPYKFIDFKEGAKSDGFSDINLTTKLNLIKDKSVMPDTSISFSYKTDSANNDKSLGTGKPEYTINSIFTKSINKIAVHTNLGYSFKEDFDDSDNEDTLNYGLAIEFGINDRLNLVNEITGNTVLKRKFNDNSCNALIGFNYVINKIITLDLGVGFEVSKASPDFKVTSGLTMSF